MASRGENAEDTVPSPARGDVWPWFDEARAVIRGAIHIFLVRFLTAPLRGGRISSLVCLPRLARRGLSDSARFTGFNHRDISPRSIIR
jgi:hypothetical protein